jgi:hypothetical protein
LVYGQDDATIFFLQLVGIGGFSRARVSDDEVDHMVFFSV